MEPIVDVLIEQERRLRALVHLPRALPHEVANAVVVNRLRAVGIERANLELVEPPPADGAKEPRLVATNRAANRRAPVVRDIDRVARGSGLLARLQAKARAQIVVEVLALHRFVHEIEVVIGREAVAARLGHHVHEDARDIAFRGARRRLHVVFVVHLEAVIHHGGAATAARPVHLQAIDAERLLAVRRSECLDVVLLRALSAADVETTGDDARDEPRHRPRVTPGGNRLVEVLVDVGLRHRAARVDDGRFATDGDRFLQRADTQLDIEPRRPRNLHDDAFAAQRRKAAQLVGDRVGPGRQRRELIRAGFASNHRLRSGDERVAADRHGDTWQNAALRITNGTGNGAGLLRDRRWRR